MDRESWSRRRLLGVLCAGLAGSTAGCSFGAPESADGTNESDVPDEFDGYSSTDGSEQQLANTDGNTTAYTEVYRSVVDSVVGVRAPRSFGQTSTGTGWVYDEGHLVTNEHVVGNADDVSIWFDGQGWVHGETVATDVYSDLAVVEVESMPEAATPLSLVDQEAPVGTEVVAVGNPFGLSGSLSTGIVSGQDRTLPAANDFSIADAVQTDAAVDPGNSGGPLVALDGEVVGVVNAGQGSQGFAISAAMVKRVVPALIETGTYDHSYMGVQLTNVTPPVIEANDLDISWGIYIDTVLDRAPSDGVLEGSTGQTTVDGQTIPTGGDVVFQMDGEDLPTREALSSFLALETSPGDTIDVGIVRDGSRKTVELTLGSRPEPV